MGWLDYRTEEDNDRRKLKHESKQGVLEMEVNAKQRRKASTDNSGFSC